jgi:hypothetical protein
MRRTLCIPPSASNANVDQAYRLIPFRPSSPAAPPLVASVLMLLEHLPRLPHIFAGDVHAVLDTF